MNDAPVPAWRRPALLGMCAFGIAIQCAALLNYFGGTSPWFGFWDAANVPGGPYSVAVNDVQPGGASDRAGLRSGDVIDLRRQSLQTRIFAEFQPFASRATPLVVERDGRSVRVTLIASTMYGANWYLFLTNVLANATGLVLALIALVIALRCWRSTEGFLLASFLVGNITTYSVSPENLVLGGGVFDLARLAFAAIASSATNVVAVALARRFGSRPLARRILEWATIAVNLCTAAAGIAAAVGLGTLRYDPNPWIVGPLGSYATLLADALASACALVAIPLVPRDSRARAAWLLAPIFGILLGDFLLNDGGQFSSNYGLLVALQVFGVCIVIAAAIAFAYALLNRRVIDLGFFFSRSIVFATLSLIVVAAFALLEWALGTVLAHAGHLTGLIANAALALALGVSMSVIHRRVDHVVDTVFFRKRHADERALRAFGAEAAFVTSADVLLDVTLDTVRRHTDARAVTLYLMDADAFVAARHFGDVVERVDENDPAILALKARHGPLDPHDYSHGAMRGDLALPLGSRGRLAGVLLCGQRSTGEAYAPDEIDALRELAHGVGSALEHLASDAKTANDLSAAIRSLQAVSADLRDGLAGLRASHVET